MEIEEKANEEIANLQQFCCRCLGILFCCLLFTAMISAFYLLFVMLFATILNACEKVIEFKNCASYIWITPVMLVGGIIICIYCCKASFTIYKIYLIRKYDVEKKEVEGESI